jgi:hypothetical protein
MQTFCKLYNKLKFEPIIQKKVSEFLIIVENFQVILTYENFEMESA